jgi:hypothetical protein
VKPSVKSSSLFSIPLLDLRAGVAAREANGKRDVRNLQRIANKDFNRKDARYVSKS